MLCYTQECRHVSGDLNNLLGLRTTSCIGTLGKLYFVFTHLRNIYANAAKRLTTVEGFNGNEDIQTTVYITPNALYR